MVGEVALRYICEEVQRQQDRPIAVYWMARAWSAAQETWRATREGTPTLSMVEEWGRLVQPEKNRGGFRRFDVRVGDHVPRAWPLYLDDLDQLLGNVLMKFDPDSVYREFQIIHPFADGNGRVGKILLNYLRGTLDDPTMPTNWFNCSNP